MITLWGGFCQAQESDQLIWTEEIITDKKVFLREPLYEIGLGAGIFNSPLYPGATESQTRYLGLPFAIYRGQFIKADRDEGVRGEFSRSKYYSFDLSFSAAFSADSNKSEVRKGMSNLDWIGQVGPRLVFILHKVPHQYQLKLNLPVRSVLTTDFRALRDQGYIFNPNFSFDVNKLYFNWLRLYSKLGVRFSSRRYSEYFYEIKPRFETVTRPAYEAKAGLQELHLDFTFGVTLTDQLKMFVGLKYSDFSRAVNKDSALLTASNTSSAALGLVWRFYESDEAAGEWY